MPAYNAEPYIAAAARSVLAQTYPHWQLHIVSDDSKDYEAVLAAAGIVDPRLRFLSSGATGGGASRARNLALELIDTPYVAILDAVMAGDGARAEQLSREHIGRASKVFVQRLQAQQEASEREISRRRTRRIR